MKVSVAEAKNKLTQLIQQVERGSHVTICRHGVPVADLVPTGSHDRIPRRFGTLRGKIRILDPHWAEPRDDVEAWTRGEL